MSETTVRIAPSPSGYLHVGTARTAIFNWLLARHNNGRFLVRIEDTDTARSDASLIEPILDAMKWLGLDWDEEPVYQSQRIDLYRKYVDQLLEEGKAYRCFCTPEELEEMRKIAMKEKKSAMYDLRWRDRPEKDIKAMLDQGKPYSVRIRIPEGETTYHDLVLGDITKQNHELEDFIICRTDGRAVYNLAVVIDDHDMNITHVVRGNDHISNTFKQIHLYRALGWEVPQFGHIPLILRPDKKKVSKRLGDKDVAEYGAEGILPEAMFNFLCLLGWSAKDDKEFYTVDELIEAFSLENVNKSNPIFNEEKLEAINFLHLREIPGYKLGEMIAPLLVEAGFTTKYWLETRWEYLLKIIELLRERCRRLNDYVGQSEYFFHDEFSYDPAGVKKRFKPESADYLETLADRYDKLDKFTHDSTMETLNKLSEELEIGKGKLIHPTRLAVSGVTAGPGLYDILEVLGKDMVVKRMCKAAAFIREMKGGEDVDKA